VLPSLANEFPPSDIKLEFEDDGGSSGSELQSRASSQPAERRA
jgi:hypothetical protein